MEDDRIKQRKEDQTLVLVVWSCDKCGASNTRRIPDYKIINDDDCDYCNKSIHEPLTTKKRI